VLEPLLSWDSQAVKALPADVVKKGDAEAASRHPVTQHRYRAKARTDSMNFKIWQVTLYSLYKSFCEENGFPAKNSTVLYIEFSEVLDVKAVSVKIGPKGNTGYIFPWDTFVARADKNLKI